MLGWVYRSRRLLAKADERLDTKGRSKLLGLLAAGDPLGEVRTAWHAKEVTRQIYTITDPDLAAEFVDRLGGDLQDESCRGSPARTDHRSLASPDRGLASLTGIERPHRSHEQLETFKRVAFGFRRFRNYRIRALLYAGRRNWDRLATITPR